MTREEFHARAEFLLGLYSRQRGELRDVLLSWLNAIENTRKRLNEADADAMEPAARGAEYQAAAIDLLTVGELVAKHFVLAELGESRTRLELMRHATEGK